MGNTYNNIKESNTGKKNTRQPFRTISLNNDYNYKYITSKDLCSYFHNDNEYIVFYSHEELSNYYAIFSFVLYYYHSKEEFINSQYYIGLLIYSEIIHNNPYFKDYYMIIYTDKKSLPILKEFFYVYPKIILAEVYWGKYSIKNSIEGTILRCLRFHPLEVFPNTIILVRDADTLFTGEIISIDYAYSQGIIGSYEGNEILDHRTFLIDIIGEWEKKFIEKWLSKENPEPILLGVSLAYLKNWHSNFPYTYSINKNMILNGFKLEQDNINKLYYNSPFGIFAGFSNFLKERPSDIWKYSYDYLINHYNLTDNIISNKYSFINSIGKDERILLFIVIVKYWYKCFYLSISYNTNPRDYFTNNRIIEEKIKYIIKRPKPEHARKCNRIMNKEIILNLGEIEYRKYKEKNFYKENIKVLSELLSPRYLDIAFNKKINNSVYSVGKKNRIGECEMINNNTKGNTINEIYRKIFKNFSREYLIWYKNIMINENKKNILLKKSNTNIKFSRIKSNLEPIEFTN